MPRKPKRPSWYKYDQPIPERPHDGYWANQQQWINRATRDIGGMNALCVDAANRICCCGADFQRAENEDTYPVRYYFGAGGETKTQQRESEARARRALKMRGQYR